MEFYSTTMTTEIMNFAGESVKVLVFTKTTSSLSSVVLNSKFLDVNI